MAGKMGKKILVFGYCYTCFLGGIFIEIKCFLPASSDRK